jgi:cellulose synthase/poly-beta-1,6-N-acetylglucosamine synthase-like glycosyltransferase
MLRGVWTSLVVLSSAAWLAGAAGWFRGVRRVPLLREVAKTSGPIDLYPSVSVVVSARDEEAGVGQALRSVLDQDYSGQLEVLAVDDRSTDRTGDIIAGLAAKWPGKLEALRVDSLPNGWLGKNYAL